MSAYKLTYFDGRGRGELIRLVLAVAGVEYEDYRMPYIGPPQFAAEWPSLKPTTPFAKAPIFEFDGHKYCQSIAISRYLAREYNLAGKSDLEEFQADMIIDCMEDIIRQLLTVLRFESVEGRKAAITKFRDVELPVQLTYLQKILEENHNGDGYFVGDSLTWADLQLAILNEWFQYLGATFDGHPKLKNLLKRVETQPRMSEWLAKRPARCGIKDFWTAALKEFFPI